MDIVLIKGQQKYAHLRCRRADGSTRATEIAAQGVAPHDLIQDEVGKYFPMKGVCPAMTLISFHVQISELGDLNVQMKTQRFGQSITVVFRHGASC